MKYMKFLTSYFYTVRYMPRYFLPISTALWDPNWFHDFRKQGHVFIDNRGVLNGLRCELLMPGESCNDLCHGRPCRYQPESCEFLNNYARQLEEIDLDIFLSRLQSFIERATTYINNHNTVLDSELSYGDMQPVFMFHETPDNPCSERVPFTKWASAFAEVEEFDWRKMK